MTTSIRLTDNSLGNRIRCFQCKRMVQMYVANEDGSLARDAESGMPIQATTALTECPFCGFANDDWRKWGESAHIKGRITSNECSDACRQATGTDCKCSCGGSSHGII